MTARKRLGLGQTLERLRPQLAAAGQRIYDQWEPEDEDGEGGICDEVAREMAQVIASRVPGIEIEDGGWEGDDHAFLVVSRGSARYVVDIPARIYEVGGGYSWRKRKGVQISPDDVVIGRV